VEDSDNVLDALSMLRTPPMTVKPGCPARRSRILLPVCPVAPATTTVCDVDSVAFVGSSAWAEAGVRRDPTMAVVATKYDLRSILVVVESS